MHNGYVIEVIVKYCDNTSKTELDTAGQKYVKQRCIYMRIFFLMNYMPMGIGRHYIIRRDITIKNASNNDILSNLSGQLTKLCISPER